LLFSDILLFRLVGERVNREHSGPGDQGSTRM
jgi:hypothetical protein